MLNLIRYPPYNHSKIKKMRILTKFGNVMVGDIQKIGMIVLSVSVLVICYKLGLFECCTGGSGHHDHAGHHHTGVDL